MTRQEANNRDNEIISSFPSQTIEQLSEKYCITGERIRQIIRKNKPVVEQNREHYINIIREKFKKFVDENGFLPSFSDVGESYDRQMQEFRIIKKEAMNNGFTQRVKLSKEQLIENLKQLSKKLGRTPSSHEITKMSGVDVKTYYYRFGALKNAQKLAGLKPNKRGAREGNKNTLKWTEEAIRQEALKYNTKYTFIRKSNACYCAARKRGIYQDVCKHMV